MCGEIKAGSGTKQGQLRGSKRSQVELDN